MEYTKVDKKNLRFLFNSPRGHLYFRRTGKGSAYHQCDGWDSMYNSYLIKWNLSGLKVPAADLTWR